MFLIKRFMEEEGSDCNKMKIRSNKFSKFYLQILYMIKYLMNVFACGYCIKNQMKDKRKSIICILFLL